MKIALSVFLLAVTVTARSEAQPLCPGDSNISNNVTVDEIVSAVNAALNGCPAPVGCPVTFDESAAVVDCAFVGRWHPLCGTSDLEAIFYNNGEELVVSFFDPDIDFLAEVVDEGIASLFGWELIEDPNGGVTAVDGEVLLSNAPRVALTVLPFEIPFSIDDCNFERFEGRFAEAFDFLGELGAAGEGASSERGTARVTAARERLRNLRADGTLERLKREARERRQRPARKATAGEVRRLTSASKR